MGAWGSGNFENDDASDWVWELDDASGFAPLSEAFAAVFEADYLEARESSIGLAAAEVVAALLGRPASKLPDRVTGYLARVAEPAPPQLAGQARQAVTRIKTDSELRELWDDTGTVDEWLAMVEELETRLG